MSENRVYDVVPVSAVGRIARWRAIGGAGAGVGVCYVSSPMWPAIGGNPETGLVRFRSDSYRLLTVRHPAAGGGVSASGGATLVRFTGTGIRPRLDWKIREGGGGYRVDRSLAVIETRVPDMGGLPLDEVENVENPVLRRALRRLGREATSLTSPSSGFSSSTPPSMSTA